MKGLNNYPKGFTLIELLVVVAIIAILASLLLPTLARAKKQSHLAGCSSNLRQMGISLIVYTLDYDGNMPWASERYWYSPLQRGLVGGGHGWTMHGLLLTYTDIPIDAFRCPADRRDYELTVRNFYNWGGGAGIPWQDLAFDYAASMVGHGMTNRRLPWSLPSTFPNPAGNLKHSAIPNPSDLFLVWDGHITIWTIGGGWNQLRGPEVSYVAEGGYHYDTTYRHAEIVTREDGTKARLSNKGPNVVLADGHVEKRINIAGGPWSDDNFNLPAQ